MELLIRTVDKSLAENASQRGDVIAAMPDGWDWSVVERNNPDWVIVTAQITEVEAEALLEESRQNETVYRRRLGVNVDLLKSGDILTREALNSRVF